MCGFIGLFQPDAAPSAALIERMRDRLVHRGPDDAGIWQTNYTDVGSVSLGFRRLSIQDTSDASAQPMVASDGALAMVFNGEIYNFVELRRELKQLGWQFRTTGDSEVLLTAYRQWGDAAITRLNGMFAFVIWDEERNLALVARDRFGEKPLYLAKLPNGGMLLGSEAKALLSHPDIDASVDCTVLRDVIAGKLIYGKTKSIFSSIRQFPAAHAMHLSIKGEPIKHWRYWTPTFGHDLLDGRRSDLQQQFRDHVERAVSMRVRADVPVTSALSGGMDSSTIVAVIAELNRGNRASIRETISARFPDDPTISEGHFIDQVLSHVGLEGQSVEPTAEGLAQSIRNLHFHQETVVGGMSMYLEWCVMRRARELGYTVMLDGQGGDEILAGYRSHFHAHLIDRYSKYGKLGLFFAGFSHDRRLRQAAKGYDDASRRFLGRDGLQPEEATNLKAYLEERYAEYDEDKVLPPSDASMLHRELAFDQLYASLPSNLFSGDRNSMAHSLETRYPLLDYDLVDFCARLPVDAFIKRGWQKRLMRDAMAQLLPTSITWRVDKVGFAAPSDRWTMDPHVLPWIEQRIFSGMLKEIPDLDGADVERMWREHRDGAADHSTFLWLWASAGEVLSMEKDGIWSDSAAEAA